MLCSYTYMCAMRHTPVARAEVCPPHPPWAFFRPLWGGKARSGEKGLNKFRPRTEVATKGLSTLEPCFHRCAALMGNAMQHTARGASSSSDGTTHMRAPWLRLSQCLGYIRVPTAAAWAPRTHRRLRGCGHHMHVYSAHHHHVKAVGAFSHV